MIDKWFGQLIIDDIFLKPTEEYSQYFEQRRQAIVDEYIKCINKPKGVIFDAVVLHESQLGHLQDEPVDNLLQNKNGE